MQVVGRIRSSDAFQVHKVPSTRGEGFMFKKSSMCINSLLSHRFSITSRRGPRTSRRQFLQASVTSRRGLHTSRRQFLPSLPRRDVDLHVATSN